MCVCGGGGGGEGSHPSDKVSDIFFCVYISYLKAGHTYPHGKQLVPLIGGPIASCGVPTSISKKTNSHF